MIIRDAVSEVNSFKHLRPYVKKNGQFDKYKKHTIKYDWNKWRKVSYDKRILAGVVRKRNETEFVIRSKAVGSQRGR